MPKLNIKSGFPQNTILGNLFSLLRMSDLQKGLNRRERENISQAFFFLKSMAIEYCSQIFLIGKKFYFKFTGGIYKYITHFLVA